MLKPDLPALYEVLFSPNALLQTYMGRHSDTKARGLDRLNGYSFAPSAIADLEVVSRKCIDGTYRFTPYLEVLKLKDRSSNPRLISIPTVRDRIVLSQLNSFLRIALRNEARLRLASEYIREISEALPLFDPTTTWTAGLDIRQFYDSIDRARLGKVLALRLNESRAVSLVNQALSTPTVPKNYKRRELSKYVNERGVPQGLAISNTLAAIYMYDVDQPMRELGVSYYRFVDDVLLVGSREATAKAAKSFAARARIRGMSVHGIGSAKGHHLPLANRFSYLGYDFQLPKVTVRASTVERLLHGVAAKITDYKYNKERTLARKPYLTSDTLKDAFLDELDEKISGAISGKRRYGWIAYFSQITDESVLHRLDAAIRSMLARDKDLKSHVPKLKRFARAFFEMRYRPAGGYVRNYDEFKTLAQKLDFLIFRGQVDSSVALTAAQIEEKFEAYRDRQLSEMLADEETIY